ncbi:uncharacterized protein C5L36_0C11620 [Pichia kudriavzevii]|uniref:U3 small nucleolar RNA-associated protein 14 n=2 Tax=Pichia kudriavzevii TaxID=4909 RepID=A0A2U9R813_PICKU|nr:uncharacterized protein C5L36_0C11620 [Pichia kudriavzevii]AWU77256.1 hypothetical protein C5L36_0C11620 [Pichia kudriavzevii]
MAKKNRSNGKSSFSKGKNSNVRSKTTVKENFKDAILDASKFLNSRSSNVDNDGEGDEVPFDDEELDSDNALGSDDDLDDYMSKTKGDVSERLNEFGEDEDGWESVDEGELMTLSEIWDRDDSELKVQKSNSQSKQHDKLVFNEDDDDSSATEGEGSHSEDSDSESNSESESDSEDDPFDEMNISEGEEVQLDSVMKSLKSKIKKDPSEKAKKVLINDKLNENEFSLPNLGDSLSLDDMLGNLDDEEQDNENEELIRDIAKHNKQLKELDNVELDEDEQNKLHNDENSAFAIPLPVNIQKRHERRAAYEIQKEQVNRWRDIIAQNRDKEVLSFVPEKPQLDKNSAFKTDNDIAVNDFESKLDSIIDQSNLESKKTEDLFENIETAKLSKAEMLKRTNELRLMRELMYRGMKDSKRLKKIKSKAYRRQLRKEKMKEKMLISQVNRQEDGSDLEEDKEDSNYHRAKERMTLKHKNTSQWAKQMIKSGMSKDKSTRDEIEEMMRQSEKLKQKQLGKKDGESSDDERDLSDLENDVDNVENLDNEKLSKIGKGVLAMDFMKNAEERERLVKLKEIDNLKRLRDAEDYEDIQNGEVDGVNVSMNTGRRMYTPAALVASAENRKLNEELMKELDEEDSRLLQNRLKKDKEERYKPTVIEERGTRDNEGTGIRSESVEDDSNPWLAEGDSENSADEEDRGRVSSKIKVVDASSSRLDKSEAKISKKLLKKNTGKKKESTDGLVSIENKETLFIVDPKKKAVKQDQKRASLDEKPIRSDDEYESDGDDVDDNRMFKQSDLIKEAFAGDDVLIEEFEQEKREVEEEEGDKQVELTTPGWGSWAGQGDEDDGWGVPKTKKRKIVKTIQGVVTKDKRLDKGKKNVIINERIIKKTTKYQADKVPYPFKTWEEYERSLRTPMGKEWSTTKTHQKLITPSVITKFGSVIDPLKAPFHE